MILVHRTASRALVLASAFLFAAGCGDDTKDEPSNGTGAGGSGGSGNASGMGGTTSGSSGSGASAGSSTTGGSSGMSGSAGTPAGGSAGSGTGGASGSGRAGTSGVGPGGEAGDGGTAGSGVSGSGGSGTPTWGVETRPTGQTCVAPATQKTMPATLTATGCVDPTDPRKPAPGMIPYGVNTPLWSDGAEKTRFFALPDDTKIHVKDCAGNASAPECQAPGSGGTYEDEGDWTFPDGTVFMKTFGFDGKLVETRLLVRKDEFDWWGYSYHWNDAQTEAELWDDNSSGYDQDVTTSKGTIQWHFPSRAQCLQCHVTAAGVSLGPETSQLNYDFKYPNGVTGNQLDTLDHIGIFDKKPPTLPVYPSPSDTGASAEERARAYLHINCGICHRPGGNFTDFDARYRTALMDTLLCKPAEKMIPAEYNLTDPLRIDPGHPEKSVVSLRMHSRLVDFQMPQIGSRVVDDGGVKVVDDWITSLATCPQ